MAERNPELQAKLQELDNDFAVSIHHQVLRMRIKPSMKSADIQFYCRKVISRRKGMTTTSPSTIPPFHPILNSYTPHPF
jgi:hypothetical protein